MNTPRRLLELGHCVVDLDRGEVRRDAASTLLTVRERELLAYLVGHRDRAVSRDALLEQVWGYSPKVLTRAVDMSVRRLRGKIEADPARPHLVQTVHGEGYRYTGPPVTVAVEARPRREVGPLFGRRAELTEALRLLASAGGCVTLIGPPGVGKTRLAREVQEAWKDEALFCDLRGVTTLEGLIGVVAAALETDVSPSADAGRAAGVLGEAMHGTGMLLVLDNFEQLVPVAAAVAERWSAAAHLLVTSRVALGTPDERVCVLNPLPEPDAIALFLHHAARRDPALTGAAEAPLVAELVRALDQLPLALVLTAARVGVLPVGALLQRVRQQVDVAGGAMDAAIAESWRLLDHGLRRALAACSVFRGGFPVEAAEYVLGGRDALGQLGDLQERSLLEVHHHRAGTRFALLDVVRSYAALHRDELDPQGVSARRHAEWYVRFGQSVKDARRDGRGSGVTDLARERENLVAVFERNEASDPVLAVQAALCLVLLFTVVGPMDASIDLMRRVVQAAMTTGDAALVAEARWGLSHCLRGAGAKDSALRELKRARALAVEAGDPGLEGDVLSSIAALHVARSQFRAAVEAYQDAMPLLVAHRTPADVGMVEVYLGRVYEFLGDTEAALRLVRRGTATLEAQGATRMLASALANAAPVLRACGDDAGSLAANERALALHRELGNSRSAAGVLVNMANQRALQGDLDGARLDYGRAIEIYRQIGLPGGEGFALANLARLELLRADLPAAMDTAGEALRLQQATGDLRLESGARFTLGVAAHLGGELSQARLHLEAAVAGFREIGMPSDTAHALAFLAAVRAESGHVDHAGRAIDLARSEISEEDHAAATVVIDLIAAAISHGPAPSVPGTFEGAMAERVARRL